VSRRFNNYLYLIVLLLYVKALKVYGLVRNDYYWCVLFTTFLLIFVRQTSCLISKALTVQIERQARVEHNAMLYIYKLPLKTRFPTTAASLA